MELISREALIEELNLIATNHPYDDKEDILEKAIATVENEPTVEAKEVLHAEWIRVGSGSLYDLYECTNCHCRPKWDCLGNNNWRIAFTDFCPDCGADMRTSVE